MKRSHILHVTDTLAIGGKERMLVSLANQLVSDGTDVSVSVTRSDTTLARELDPSIPVVMLDRRSSFDQAGFRRFLAFTSKHKPDLFHAHGRASFSFLAFLKTVHRISAPILFHDHYGPIEIDEHVPTWFRLWGRFCVDYYVGVYSKLGEWAASAGVPAHKIGVIENGIDLRPFDEARACDLRTTYNLPRDKTIGVILGGLRPEKGLDLLVQAVARSTLGGQAHFLVVGNSQDERYVAACLDAMQAMNVAQHFTLIGQQTAVPEILKGADFALMPSRSESGPLVLIEYLAAGLPLVAFCVGAISKSAARLGVAGLVDPVDLEAFARELDCLLAMQPAELSARGLRGQRIAQANFDIRKKMAEWHAAYEYVLENRKRGV